METQYPSVSCDLKITVTPKVIVPEFLVAWAAGHT